MSSRWSTSLQRHWWRPRPSALAWLLSPLSGLYLVAWALRRAAFASGLLRPGRAPVPVVVVGNLIVGGAGKTPTVIALVEALRREGWTPGVLSRGYGGSAQRTTAPLAIDATTPAAHCGDEPLLIHRRTGAPVWVGARRVDVARALCAAHPEVNLLVSDDGLQHLALHRDAQLVVFDERGVGNRMPLPAGPLREPLAARAPTRTVVLYNASAPTTRWPGACVKRRLAGAVPLAAWWRGQATTPAGLDVLRGTSVLAAAGIAAPERFFTMLEAQGLRIRRLALPDHAALDPLPWPTTEPAVVVTEKDAVKLDPATPGAAAVHVVTLDFSLPEDTLQALRALLPPPPRP